MNRADRRRQLKDDERSIAHGLDAARLDGSQVSSLMRVLRERLKGCAKRGSATELMQFIYNNLTKGAQHIGDVPVACAKGCSHCCNIWVDATAPEIFYAVDSIRDRKAAALLVDAACAVTVGQDFNQRGDAVTPCPLLLDNLCSIYPARPINCRTAVSVDVGICERSYLHISGEHIPTPMVWMALRSGYVIALRGAVENAGLISKAYEWNEALRFALANPDAEERWFAGEDPFAGLPRAGDVEKIPDDMFPILYRDAFG